MPRIFKYGNIPNISFTPYKELNTVADPGIVGRGDDVSCLLLPPPLLSLACLPFAAALKCS